MPILLTKCCLHIGTWRRTFFSSQVWQKPEYAISKFFMRARNSFSEEWMGNIHLYALEAENPSTLMQQVVFNVICCLGERQIVVLPNIIIKDFHGSPFDDFIDTLSELLFGCTNYTTFNDCCLSRSSCPEARTKRRRNGAGDWILPMCFTWTQHQEG